MAEAIALAGAGWIASPIIASLLKEGFNYLNVDISAKLQDLETTILPQFQFVIEAAEGSSEHKAKLQSWLKRLKDAVYEAEDVLDLYRYQLLEEKVSDLNTRPALKPLKKFAREVNTKLSILSPQKIKLRRSLDKLEKIATEAKGFRELLGIPIGNDRTVTENLRNIGEQPNVTSSFLLHEVFGREKELDEIIDKYLLDPSEASEPEKSYSVGAIVAIGGAGKTTLAQLVYNDKRVIDYFDIKMWVCISRKLDLSRHTREMIESSTSEKCSRLENLNTMQNKLAELVKSKKILLVLDDVWCDKSTNETEWQQHLAPLAKSVKRGSKILVTTRTKNLPVALSPQYSMALEDLEENHILSLFMLHAFGSSGIKLGDSNLREQLEHIGKQIVHKLHGSPLAAKAVSCQLGKTLKVDAWKAALERDNLRDSQQALLWSYQRLNAPLQRCFSYCSLFPKGHAYKAKEMVHLWIAEGFINSSNNSKRMEDIGREYFDELVSGSFLQNDKYYMYTKSYYMHDLFHDLAENISKEDCLRIEDDDQVREIPQTIRHLSILGGPKRVKNISLNKLENLRTLMIEAGSLSSDATVNLLAATEKYKSLRVLMIDDVSRKTLTKVLPNLKHLRFLSLQWSQDKRLHDELPAALGKLYYLQVLRTPGHDSRLPRSVKSLINLRYVMGDNVGLALIPDIGKLTSLQQLSKFIVKKEKGHDIGQLKNLNELRESLTISKLGNVEGNDKAAEANLKAKRHLERLCLELDIHNDEGEYKRYLDLEVLEGLQPHPNLTELTIRWYKSPRYPSWLLQEECLPNLRKLTFDNCAALEVLPPISNLFPNCSELIIWGLFKLRKFPSLPQSLKRIEIRDCPSLIIVSEDEVQNSDDERKKSIMTTMRSYQLVNRELNAKEIERDCLEVKRLLESEKIDVPEDFTTLATTLQSCERMDDFNMWKAYCHIQEQRLEAIFGRQEKNELILPSSLQTLVLVDFNITDRALSQSLQGLTSLESLWLGRISTITTLPSEEVLHHLTALTSLSMHNCPGISSFPEHFPQSLKELYLSDWPSISSLPKHLPQSLNSLELNNCPIISSLPKYLPQSLNSLKLSNCPSISSLPEHLPQSLWQLNLRNCPSISSLPERLPQSLNDLRLHNCPSISSLPEHLPQSLVFIVIKRCQILEERCQSPNGEDWPKIAHIPDRRIYGQR